MPSPFFLKGAHAIRSHIRMAADFRYISKPGAYTDHSRTETPLRNRVLSRKTGDIGYGLLGLEFGRASVCA
jgi:hypothetical protein